MKEIFNPFFQLSVLIFSIHQLLQKILNINIVWADNYLDDLLCMPIFLTLILIERKTLFKHPLDYSFSFLDTMLYSLVLSIIFEEIFPHINYGFTKDYWDYLYYFAGALFFYYFINKKNEAKSKDKSTIHLLNSSKNLYN